MEAKLRVLASGSSGNSLFVAAGETKLLIDAGIALRPLERALAQIDEKLSGLSAVLLTHEHGDHVSGLAAIKAKCPHVPVYSTRGTARALGRAAWVSVDRPLVRGGQAFNIGAVTVVPFATSHDAAEPVGFRISYGDFVLGVATDLGHVTPDVRRNMSGCRVLVLEANHDEDLLRNGPYPGFLKRRIASPLGHLSNRQAAALAGDVAGPELQHLVLAHLSLENNTPQLALDAVATGLSGLDRIGLQAALRTSPGEVLSLCFEPDQSASEPRGHSQPSLFSL